MLSSMPTSGAPATISKPPASDSGPKPKGRPKVVAGKITTGGKEEACFFCSHCSQAFNSEALAQEHIKTHMPPKPFRCGQCGEEFASKLGVLSHMEQHVKEKNYPCDRCDEKFAFHCVLCMHKRTIHRKQRPMTCMVCGESSFYFNYDVINESELARKWLYIKSILDTANIKVSPLPTQNTTTLIRLSHDR